MTQMLGAFVSVYKTDNPTFLTFLHIDRGKHLSDFYQNSLKKKDIHFVVLEVIPAYVWHLILYIPVLKRSIQEIERLGPDHYFLIKI